MLLFFGTDLLIASRLGISKEADAFFVALTVPRVLYALCVSVGGALVPVFVPTDRSLLEVKSLYATVFNIALLALGVLVILSMLFAPILIIVISPGVDEATAQQAIVLLGILLPSVLFSGLAALLMGLLNAHEQFTSSALSNLVRAMGILGGMALLSGYGVVGMSIGWVLGSLIHLIVSLGMCRWQKVFHYQLCLEWRDPALGDAWRLTRTALGGRGTQQVMVIFEKVIGSFLPPGTISALNYAMNIVRMGGGLAVQIVAQVSLPALTAKIAQNSLDEAHSLFIHNLRFVTYLIFPIVAVLMGLSLPLSTFLLQRGTITATQISYIASLLSLASIWLIFQVFYEFAIIYLYARRHTWAVTRCYIILLVGFIIWAGLIGLYGAGKGLVLAGSLSLLPSSLYGLWILKIPHSYWKTMITYTTQLAVAALVMGGCAFGIATISSFMLEALPALVRAGLTLSFGLLSAAVVWLGVTALLGMSETLRGTRLAWTWAHSLFRKNYIY